MKNFKPLLSATYATDTTLQFPYLGSRKLDGIRCIIIDGLPVSRSLKPIPNKFVQSVLADTELDGLDGELIVGAANDPDCFRNTTIVMSHDKEQDFTFHVFDDVTDPDAPFSDRLESAQARLTKLDHPNIQLVDHRTLPDMAAFEAAKQEFVGAGYEGLMIRSLTGRYKFGRSTLKENILIKCKRFSDSEAVVMGFEEQLHNGNIAVTDALGHSKRSSHQGNKTGLNTLGALVCRDIGSGVEFNCGTGLTAEDRQTIWNNKPAYFGRQVKYKFFSVGVKDKPRHPVFLGWRQD